MPTVIREFEDKEVKLTVEEIDGHHFIATRWDKDFFHENARTVYEFETVDGAMGKMLELMIDYYEETV